MRMISSQLSKGHTTQKNMDIATEKEQGNEGQITSRMQTHSMQV